VDGGEVMFRTGWRLFNLEKNVERRNEKQFQVQIIIQTNKKRQKKGARKGGGVWRGEHPANGISGKGPWPGR